MVHFARLLKDLNILFSLVFCPGSVSPDLSGLLSPDRQLKIAAIEMRTCNSKDAEQSRFRSHRSGHKFPGLEKPGGGRL